MKRRQFIGTLAAAGILGAVEKIEATPVYKTLEGISGMKAGLDENLIAFMTDIHLNPGGYQHERIKKVIADMLSADRRPAQLIILGDLACQSGSLEEYQALKEVIKPVEDAGIKITMTMGNHDWRPNFSEVFPDYAAKSKLSDRLVFVVETPATDIIVLDSLIQPENFGRPIMNGEISDGERSWLDTYLTEHPDKPVLISAHHPLQDTKLNDVLSKHACVKGYIYGHDHRWRRDFLMGRGPSGAIKQTLCLPSTGQWGDLGWAMMEITGKQATVTLHQDDFFFPAPAKTPESAPAQWKLMVEQHKHACCIFSLE